MGYPKIKSVKAIDNKHLLVRFDNDVEKKYNVSHLLEKEMFYPLKNPAFFKAVHVEQGGYAVAWNNLIDLSEYELWTNGQTISS
jgi:hypothetical protein